MSKFFAMIVVAVLTAAASAEADGRHHGRTSVSFGFSGGRHYGGGYVSVGRPSYHVYRPSRIYVVAPRPYLRPAAFPVYADYIAPGPAYVPPPRPAFMAPSVVASESPAVVAGPTYVDNSVKVGISGNGNTVNVGAGAGGGVVVRPVEMRPAVCYRIGDQVNTTHDFKFVDPATGRLMEADVDHETGIIEDIDPD